MSDYSWKQAQEDRGKQLNASAAEEAMEPKGMSRSLIDAAAEAISQVAKSEFPDPDLDWKPVHWRRESTAAVVAVLETLAGIGVGSIDGIDLERLASEVREGT